MVVGLISDTHGLVRPGVYTAFQGVDLILHAGDVGGDDVLDELQLIAPVQAVFGNVDDPANPRLSAELNLSFGGYTMHVSHGHELGSPTRDKLFAAYDARIVMYGHTHEAQLANIGDRILVNPGAAGPKRFNVVPSVAIMRVQDPDIEIEIRHL